MDSPDRPFFRAGGALPADAPSYIERKADAELLAALQRGEFCYVLDARQVGKSSLMARTTDKLRKQGITVAILSLDSIGIPDSPEQWYYGMLFELGKQWKLNAEFDAFWDANPKLPPLQRFLHILREIVFDKIPGNIVLFVDEVDYIRQIPFDTDEFIVGLRYGYNVRTEDADWNRFAVCLVGSSTPARLMKNADVTPFNVGVQILLTDFTETEALPLGRGLDEGQRAGKGETLLRRILHWTGGHPYLTQRLAMTVRGDAEATDEKAVDTHCARLFFAKDAMEREDNLAFVSRRLLESEKTEAGRAALLDLYARARDGKAPDDPDNPLMAALKISGAVRSAGGMLQVRNRIYREVFGPKWIHENMPGAIERAKQAAVRKAQLRIGSIAAVIILLISGLALWAVRSRSAAIKSANDLTYLLYTANANLMQEAWDTNRTGRVQELLQETAGNRSNFEWRFWQRLCHLDQLTLTGHKKVVQGQTDTIVSVGFSPDGKRIVTGGEDNTARVWDAETGKQLQKLEHFGKVNIARFSPDSKQIFTGGSDGVVVWDATNGTSVHKFELPRDFLSVPTVAAECQCIALFSDPDKLRIWDLETGKETRQLILKLGSLNCLAFSPDRTRIVTGGNAITPEVWDAKTGQRLLILRAHAGPIRTAAFSPDGTRIFTAGDDNTVKIWDTVSGHLQHTLKGHTGAVYALAFSPDGKRIATGSTDYTAMIWDAETGKELLTLRGHTLGVRSVAFSPDGKRVITGSEDGTAKVWDAQVQHETLTLHGKINTTGFVSLAANGQRIALIHTNNIAICNAETGSEVKTLAAKHWTLQHSLSLSPDGQRIVVSDGISNTEVWEIKSGRKLYSLIPQASSKVIATAFSQNQLRMATIERDDYNYDGLTIYDARTGYPLSFLRREFNQINCAAFSPDGKTIAAGVTSRDVSRVAEAVVVWEIASGKELFLLNHASAVNAIAFSPDGKYLLSGCEDHTAQLWDMQKEQARKSEQEREPVQTLRENKYAVTSVAFSPDGKRVLTGSYDNTAVMYETATWRKTLTFKHEGAVFTVAFFPDNKRVLTGGNDGKVKIWFAP